MPRRHGLDLAAPGTTVCVVDDGAITYLGDQRSDRRLRLRHHARAAELSAIRRRISAWAGGNCLPAHAVIDLQLAVGEAVANGVEHAYGADATRVDAAASATVEVELELDGSPSRPVVAVTVTDHGRWRPVPVDPGHRGRGLALIRKLSRRMQVSISGQGTRVCFEIPLDRLQQSPAG
jgi:anti-sigma regulatory factor (Ser/Thr protein kinase)